MAESSKSTAKRRKFTNEVEIDRISSLPNEVLCYILSFLPTKEAIVTGILSSRWRSLWTLVPVIDLEDYGFRSRSNCQSIVNRVLILRKAQCISKLRLSSSSLEGCDTFNVSAWISAAVAGNVEELVLSFRQFGKVDLLLSFFTCKTIVVLKLSGQVNLDVTSFIHLPLLKDLDIMELSYVHEDSVTRLLSGCPILEDLHLTFFGRFPEQMFKICVPLSKKLWIRVGTPRCKQAEIRTPSLEFLYIRVYYSQDLVGNFHNVEKANINIAIHEDDGGFKLLKALNNVKFLSIVDPPEKQMDDPTPDFSGFPNLVHLQLNLPPSRTSCLFNFLKKCNKLEVLVIKMNFGSWAGPTGLVPDCLLSSLTTFEMRGFQGTKGQHKLVSYILKSALVLKTAKIQTNCLKLKEKLRILKKLSLLPRGSNMC